MNQIERRDAGLAYISDDSVLRSKKMQTNSAKTKLY